MRRRVRLNIDKNVANSAGLFSTLLSTRGRRPIVRPALESTFFNWMKEKGKLGRPAQRYLAWPITGSIFDEILKVMELVG